MRVSRIRKWTVIPFAALVFSTFAVACTTGSGSMAKDNGMSSSNSSMNQDNQMNKDDKMKDNSTMNGDTTMKQ